VKNRTTYLLFFDIIGANGALLLAYLLLVVEPFRFFTPTVPGVLRGVSGLFCVVFSSYFMELYSRDLRFDLAALAARVAVALNLSFLGLSLFIFMVPSMTVSQRFLTLYLLGFGSVQFLIHAGFRYTERKLHLLPKVLIFGTGSLAAQIGDIVSGLTQNYILVGYLPAGSEQIEVPREKIVGTGKSLLETVLQERVNKIVVAVGDRLHEYPLQEILTCKLNGVSIYDAPTFYERATGRMLIEQITPEWFIFSQGFCISNLRRAIKRGTDILICLLVLPVLLLLFPVIALIIRLDSSGPVFFGQIRVGENEKPFKLYKLRTMNNNAEFETGAVWAQDNDPRITRLGHFLRKSRLDEFPQFYNVLIGDMSLVGPRPERPEFIAQLKEIIPYYSERHLIKPGVTGWAQVNYPYGASVEDAIEKLRYDLYYLKNFSIQLDAMIIVETVKVVFNQRGGR
jgi:sugar transferase (PEP-CTERM system associated)